MKSIRAGLAGLLASTAVLAADFSYDPESVDYASWTPMNIVKHIDTPEEVEHFFKWARENIKGNGKYTKQRDLDLNQFQKYITSGRSVNSYHMANLAFDLLEEYKPKVFEMDIFGEKYAITMFQVENGYYTVGFDAKDSHVAESESAIRGILLDTYKYKGLTTINELVDPVPKISGTNPVINDIPVISPQ